MRLKPQSAPLYASMSVVFLPLLANCSAVSVPAPGEKRANTGSQVTSVTLGLPDLTPMKARVSNVDTLLKSFRFTINPEDPSCAKGTKLDQTGDYGTSRSFNASLQQGCSYLVTLEIGSLQAQIISTPPTSPNPNPTTPVSYEGRVKEIIERGCTKCHSSIGGQFPTMTSYSLVLSIKDRVLLRAVTKADMPPAASGITLREADLEALKAWVAAGAPEKDTSPGTSGGNPTSPPPSTIGANPLTLVAYFRNTSPFRIDQSEIAGKASYKPPRPLVLDLTEEGRKAGLSALGQPNTGGSQTQPPPSPSVSPAPPLPPQPTPTPEPISTSANLSPEQDFSLVGSGASEKFSSAFGGAKYMMIDLSQAGCGGCVQMAEEMNQNSQLKKMFDGTICGHVTIVPRGQLSQWVRQIGGSSSFSGKHSYESSIRQDLVADAFGLPFNATPTTILIDRNGKTIDSDEGAIPQQAAKLCR